MFDILRIKNDTLQGIEGKLGLESTNKNMQQWKIEYTKEYTLLASFRTQQHAGIEMIKKVPRV